MRYLMLIRVGSGMEAANDKLMAEMNDFVDRSKRSGILVDTGGLQGRESGTTLGLSGGKITVTDGPFTEANEVVGGFAIIDSPFAVTIGRFDIGTKSSTTSSAST